MKLCRYNSQKGFTIIEVLVALFIIALIIMGGGMFFFYGRVNIVREAHRRAAVLVASQRLEELKGADFGEISDSEDEYYIIWNEEGTEGDWDFVTYATDPPDDAQEPVDVDNLLKTFTPHPTMVTKAEYGGSSHDYLKVTVTVNWVDSRSNSVSATTLIAPR